MSSSKENNLMLSVCMITYNHANYIRNAIEGVLSQKTSFNFELVIGEDCSSDNTYEICKEYHSLRNINIVLLSSERNLGVIPNLMRTLIACRGKYIAFCEGDDFWIDPYKLQLQIDFLESNAGYSLCFHDAIVYWENKNHYPYYFCKNLVKSDYNIYDVIGGWFIPSASIVFKKEFIFPLPEWFKDIYNGDYALQLILALKGNFYYINKVMSVYRQTPTNLSATIDASIINNHIEKLFKLFDNFSEEKYSYQIKKRINNLYKKPLKSKIKSLIYKLPVGKNIWNILKVLSLRNNTEN